MILLYPQQDVIRLITLVVINATSPLGEQLLFPYYTYLVYFHFFATMMNNGGSGTTWDHDCRNLPYY